MNKKGFTLIELTVVIGILAILMLAITPVLTNVLRYQAESRKSDNLRDNIQFILNVMDKELRTASAVTKLSNSSLKFQDQDGVIVTYSVTYSEVGGVLKRTVSGSTVDLSSKDVFIVNSLVFDTNESLVTVIITAKSLDNKDTVTMQSTTATRN
jgi:prepilin-type N-terminal cleavage/methylation domain-containing protein